MERVKQVSFIAVMVVMLMGLAACGDDDEIGSKASLIGVLWQRDSSTYWEKQDEKIIHDNETTYDPNNPIGAERLIFYEDGKCDFRMYNGSWWETNWGTWTMKSNKIYFDDGDWTSTIKTLNKNTLILETHEKEVYSGTTYEYYSLETYHRVIDEEE
jgi:hypothetical protein